MAHMRALDRVFADTGAEEEDINHAVAQHRITESDEYRSLMEASKVKTKDKFQEIMQKAKAHKEARMAPVPPAPVE